MMRAAWVCAGIGPRVGLQVLAEYVSPEVTTRNVGSLLQVEYSLVALRTASPKAYIDVFQGLRVRLYVSSTR